MPAAQARRLPQDPFGAGDLILARCGALFDRRLEPASTAPIAVAFSGGGDSLALLLAAAAWAARTRRRVIALTVDHGIQTSSAEWAEAAMATADRLGVESRTLVWRGQKPARGIPASARAARHRLLADAAREAGARVILLGHTRDDITEARLMRQDGGSVGEPRTWSPSPVWPEGRGLFLLRPLLGMGRAELRNLIAGSGLSWIEDPANDNPAFARTRARQTLHPPTLAGEVARRAGGGATSHSARSAAPPPLRGPPPPQAVEDDELASLADLADVDLLGSIRVSREALGSVSSGAAARFLMIACLCAGGGERPPRRVQVRRLASRLAVGEDFTATLAGARVTAGVDVMITREAGEAGRGGLAAVALTPGAPVVWDGRFVALAPAEGLTVRPLRGLAGRLPLQQRQRLRSIHASVRAGLPVIVSDGELVTCPMLAWGAQAVLRGLVRERLRAACGGFVDNEAQLSLASHGEPLAGALS